MHLDCCRRHRSSEYVQKDASGEGYYDDIRVAMHVAAATHSFVAEDLFKAFATNRGCRSRVRGV